MPDSGSASPRFATIRRLSPTAWASCLVVVATLALNLAQQPGRITFDTKLDLQFGAADFLARSASIWNGDWALGGLQNQASGYLFPMGPAFLLGDLLGVPMWVWERLWSAAVMLIAYEGVRRLAACWPGIAPFAAVLAGLAYMVSPRVLTTVGGLSGETLPGAVLPWTLVPLALYLLGRLRGPVALVLSAATVPFMGGQNATLVVACLLLPALLLAAGEGRPWRRRVLDLVTWGALVLVATLWWVVPLLLMGGYAPPFLDFIESAQNTAGATGWLSSVRGTSHWVAFFPDGGGLGWVGGYELASSPALLLTTVLAAGGGLIGLLRTGLWQSKVLVLSVLGGLAVLTAGSGGLAGSVLSEGWLVALDTFLAPLRNVHKFDPIVRLPLSLGLAALATSIPRWWRVQGVARRLPAQALVSAAIAATVMAAALPAASGSLRSADGMEDIPAGWRAAASYLDEQPGPVRALVLPGTGSASQFWGRTVDEPIQVLGSPPWLARAQMSVASGSTRRLMDSLETSVSEGRPQAALASTLRRMGITHVVLRRDLDPEDTDAPSPAVVEASVAGIEGARRVAGFSEDGRPGTDVEVYALEATADPRVALLDESDPLRVSGGPEVVGSLEAGGLLGEDQSAALVEADDGPDVVTDSNRRVERNFGRQHDAVSGVMTREDRYRVDRQEHDYVDAEVPDEPTVAEYDDGDQIVASTSGGYADVLGPVRPEEHPYAAFDDSVFTAWTSAPLSRPVGQWLEVRFGQEVTPGPVSLSFDTVAGAGVTSVRLTTDGGSVTAPVGADGSITGIRLPAVPTSSLRVTIAAVTGGEEEPVRLSDVRIEDHPVRRTLRLPGQVGPSTSVFVSSERPRRACLVLESSVSCDQDRQVETPETPGFARTFDVTAAGTWQLSGTAVATNGRGVEQLFIPISDQAVTVVGTTTFAGDPAVAAAQAFDGRDDTGWYASPLDPAPALQLSWSRVRTISSVGARLAAGQPGRLPDTLLVDPLRRNQEPQLVATTGPTAGAMRPVRTDQLRVTAFDDSARQDGVGISELVIDDLVDLRYSPDPDSATGTACGFGPTIEVDGRVVPTEIVGRLSDVRSGADLQVVPCGEEADFPLAPGTHRLQVVNPAGFAVSDLWLEPSGTFAADAAAPSSSEVLSWGSTGRTVEVASEGDAVLALTESVNRGWSARVGSVVLDPVTVDGWRQGWAVPAGTVGVVELTYGPQTAFRVALVAGLLLAGLLVVAAVVLLVMSRIRPRREAEPDSRPEDQESVGSAWPLWLRRAGLVVGGLILAIVSLPLAAGAVVGWLTRSVAVLVLSTVCLGGLLVAALIALAEPESVVVPPLGSDLVAALVVGLVAGRVLSRGRRTGQEA